MHCLSWSGAHPGGHRQRRVAAGIQAKLIDSLPEIVAKLPKPAELRAVTIGRDSTTVAGLVAELGAVVGALRSVVPTGSDPT